MLRFTSLTVENFGPFKGTQTIDFSDSDGVTFIWGNNGRGKTTLLNIIRYALFGKFQNRRGVDVDLASMSNIEGRSEDGKYDFKVVLRMTNDNKKYELTRQYVVRKGISRPSNNDDFEERVYLKEDGSILPPDARDHKLNLIMPQGVSRFFLFDGELLQEYEELLMDDSDDGATIKASIETILGLPVLTNGAIDTEAALADYRKDKTRIAQSNKETQKIATRMAALDAERTEHTAERERLTAELEDEYARKAKLEDEARQSEHVSALLRDMDTLNGDISEKTATRDAILAQIVTATSDAWRGLVGESVKRMLSDIDEQIRALEEKETTQKVAKQFLEDMRKAADRRHCHVCDQDITPDAVEKLIERIRVASSDYEGLSETERQMLQALRVKKASLERLQASSKKDVLELLEGQLATIDVEIDDAKRKLKEIRDELERHGDIQELSQDRQTNVKALAACLKKIDNLKEGIQQEKDKIKEIDSAYSSLEEKLNRASTAAEMQLAMRKVSLCEQINSIFEQGIASYRDKLKSDVERDATELFLQISNDPDYVSLSINENYGLSMVHVSGEIVPLRSAGFEHVVALALIGALHKNAPLRGPIIMDSPFGRLDPIHTSNITKVLPKMSEQIVLLAYTREIDEQQARNTLGASLKREYRLQRYSSFNTQIEAQME